MNLVNDSDDEKREVEILDAGESVESPGASNEAEGGGDNAELARLQGELEDLRDRSLRTLADYENYRKRVQRETAEERRYASAALLREFVDVVDNLERARSAAGSVEELKQGVELILRQMHELLRRAGVRRVTAIDEPFDPNCHEAVSRQEDRRVDQPTVTAEHQVGYWLHDRLLRPAMVSVAVPGEGSREEQPGEDR